MDVHKRRYPEKLINDPKATASEKELAKLIMRYTNEVQTAEEA